MPESLKQTANVVRLPKKTSDDFVWQVLESLADHELRVDLASRSERDTNMGPIRALRVPIEPLGDVRGYGDTRAPELTADLESLDLGQQPNGAMDVD